MSDMLRGFHGGTQWLLVALVSAMPPAAIKRGAVALAHEYGKMMDEAEFDDLGDLMLGNEHENCQDSATFLMDVFLQVAVHGRYTKYTHEEDLTDDERQKIADAMADDDEADDEDEEYIQSVLDALFRAPTGYAEHDMLDSEGNKPNNEEDEENQ